MEAASSKQPLTLTQKYLPIAVANATSLPASLASLSLCSLFKNTFIFPWRSSLAHSRHQSNQSFDSVTDICTI